MWKLDSHTQGSSHPHNYVVNYIQCNVLSPSLEPESRFGFGFGFEVGVKLSLTIGPSALQLHSPDPAREGLGGAAAGAIGATIRAGARVRIGVRIRVRDRVQVKVKSLR